jgi:glycosyltransferase involved in cell wall biosynthesis
MRGTAIRVRFCGRRAVQSLADRAAGLARHFGPGVEASFDFRAGPGLGGAATAFRDTLGAARSADALWLLSQHPARIAAARLGRLLFGTPFIVDTGDLLEESERTAGRGRLRCLAVRLLERASMRLADAVVVRGTRHVEIAERWGARAVMLVPDGVECAPFARGDRDAVRREIGAGDAVVVGVVSTIALEPRLGLPSPGWDVVECVARLPDLGLIGLVVGDGPGLAALRKLAERRGVAQRVRFVGRRPLEALPAYFAAMDVFLHTALNNPMSQVRTTGKLPLLLAAGRAAVVSRVGEAARVLEGTGMLLDFDGTPEQYAVRLAERVREIVRDRAFDRWRETGPEIARREFDYAALARRAEALIRRLAAAGATTADAAGARPTRG